MQRWVVFVIGMVAVTSCSGGGGGAAAGDLAACNSYCQVRESKNCPGEPSRTECSSDCGAKYSADRASCASETDAWIACQAQALPNQCDAYGIDEDYQTTLAACGPQVQAYQVCTACTAQPNDNPCKACTKTECCSERQAYYGDAETAGYDQCKATCIGSAECDACVTQFPNAAAKAQAAVDCALAKCTSCQSP